MPLSGGWLPAGLDLLLACLARLPGQPPGQVARTQAPSRRVRLRYIGTANNDAWLHTRCAGLNLRTLLKAGLTRSAGAWVLA